MTDSRKKPAGRRRAAPVKGRKPAASAKAAKPEWAKGLRQLYDSVVDEPLPDAFRSLLDKLDKK